MPNDMKFSLCLDCGWIGNQYDLSHQADSKDHESKYKFCPMCKGSNFQDLAPGKPIV